ncbi:Predicted nucleotidyltransferase [Caldanaerobius fijiensis DSM 17918]|uniref:tRNA(Met) cytidine acetate ligase n=1 Tax=Caldanaerobius fijiensis DSM 17918 TaxID=1121256 RepID=A0A1M4ZS96_9THEO|nr:nucleotidyltransferase [Caldanaerobius fijiensis]SHF20960.1 Predicted nucleotidyltransferase [Caldanaerobius fijiensis DSM 17918]
MHVMGIIVEYNPFHNGHLYHLNKSKEVTDATHVIAVMSGNYIQRGEPALVDKWARAKMALSCGVDLVIELPFVYAVQSAEIFAYGAIKLLDSTNIVDSICFGSESGDIKALTKIAEILAYEPNSFKSSIKKYLKQGRSFPEARQIAIAEHLKASSNILATPNNILAIEYIKNLMRLNSKIKPYTIKRISSGYHDVVIRDNIPSATAIRNILKASNMHKINGTMPDICYEELIKEFNKGKGPVFIEDFEMPIFYTLRKVNKRELMEIQDVSEGLENRLIKYSREAGNLNELISHVKTKRYTMTRIKRILIHTMIGIKEQDLKIFNANGGPQYIRVLGFNEKGRNLLKLIKERSQLPIITNVRNTAKYPALIKSMLEIEARATDLYVLGFKNPLERKAGRDQMTSPIVV